MHMNYKLGSLFDGSGGFPLAGSLCGIEPRWASEVEPYPIAVTRSRFPNMKHIGDISKVKGAEIEPVDIITFGSPCQDLSVAGKRAGLKHEDNGDDETTRSGLFMEAVRIIKEMREATNGLYPTFALWENVPGAFSSNKGEDFRTVLAELIGIVEPNAVMPPVPKAGWAYADSYIGDGWSLAYRVFDAQYWGVPQRRRRIHLVLDLRGERAREVLFEREGVRGYFAKSGAQRQGIAADTERSVGTDDCEGDNNSLVPYTIKIRSGCEGGGKGALIQVDKSATLATNNDQYLFQPIPNLLLDDQGGQQINVRTDEKCPTLRAETHGNHPCVVQSIAYSFDSIASNSMKSKNPHSGCRQVEVAKTLDTTDPNPCKNQGGIAVVEVYDARGNGDGKTANTLTGDHNNRITDYTSIVCEPLPIHDQATRFAGKRGDKADGKGNGLGVGSPGDPMNTLTSADRHAVVYATDIGFFNSQENVSPTLLARMYKDPHLVTYEGFGIHYIVRRLTPTECARLQGFADRWGDIDEKTDFTDEEYRFWLEVRNTHAAINGRAEKEYTKAQMLTWYNKLHTDSAEYKMWGNGIALPPALYCMQGIADTLNKQTV